MFLEENLSKPMASRDVAGLSENFEFEATEHEPKPTKRGIAKDEFSLSFFEARGLEGHRKSEVLEGFSGSVKGNMFFFFFLGFWVKQNSFLFTLFRDLSI